MSRKMIDCTGANAVAMHARFPTVPMVAWYGTGSPGLEWTLAQRTLWSHATMVEIDQGFTDSPQRLAVVRDVERGAWTASNAVNRVGWDVPDPTIYCDRNDAEALVKLNWTGAVWLADPGWTGASPPVIGHLRIVAVQNVFAGDHDESIVYDDAWPAIQVPPPVNHGLSVTVLKRQAHCAFADVTNADHYVINYQASPGSQIVLVAREPADHLASSVHTGVLTVPGAHGGTLVVWAIVKGNAVHVGSQVLP